MEALQPVRVHRVSAAARPPCSPLRHLPSLLTRAAPDLPCPPCPFPADAETSLCFIQEQFPYSSCVLGVLGMEAPRTAIGNGEQGAWVWESLRLVLWAVGREGGSAPSHTHEGGPGRRAGSLGTAAGTQLPLPLHPGRDPLGELSLLTCGAAGATGAPWEGPAEPGTF